MQYIKHTIKNHRKTSAWLVIGVSLCNILALLYNYNFKFVIDAVVAKDINLALKNFILLVILQIFVTLGTLLIYDYYLKIFQKKIERGIRYDLMKEILSWPFSKSKDISSGKLSTLINQDVSQIGQYVSLYDFMLVANTLRFFITYFLLFTLDRLIALVVLLSVPLYYLLTKFTLEPMKNFVDEGYIQKDKLNNSFIDILNNLMTIKSYKLENIIDQEVEKKTSELYLKEKGLQKWTAIFYFIRNFLTSFMPVAILGLSIVRIISGNMTIGTMVAIFGFLDAVYLPISELFYFKAMKNNLEPVVDRIEPIISSKINKNDMRDLSYGSPMIKTSNLSYSYGKNQVIDKLNLNIDSPGLYRICGQNGNGKTTLFNIIAGLYNDFSGKVQLNLSKTYPNLSYMNQNDTLFASNLLDNISLFNKNKLNKNSLDLIEKFRKREDTADSFSGGEKRLFLFLRTINAKASIYLFDEPFEGVDPVNKEIMKDIIRNLAKDKIVLIITHDDEDLANLYYEDIKLK